MNIMRCVVLSCPDNYYNNTYSEPRAMFNIVILGLEEKQEFHLIHFIYLICITLLIPPDFPS